MTKQIDDTINTVRSIASELRPRILDDLGLAAAIEWQAQQFQARTGIICQVDALVENGGVSQEQATAIFRIFQEAMTNILRHAQATRVNLTIEEEEGAYILEVRDNGRGITEEERTGVALSWSPGHARTGAAHRRNHRPHRAGRKRDGAHGTYAYSQPGCCLQSSPCIRERGAAPTPRQRSGGGDGPEEES